MGAKPYPYNPLKGLAPMSQVITAQIQLWRQQSRDGTITQADMKLAIEAIRKERVQASEVSTKSRAKKVEAKKVIDSDDLLSQLF